MISKDKNCTISAESEKFHQENLVESSNVANFATEEESINTFKPIFIDPTTDFGFKRLFGKEIVMREFLNYLIAPESPIEKVTFIDKEMINRTKDDRTTYFDLRCKTEDGREFIVEMQKAWQEFFLDRIIYYLSQSISPQGYKGTDETGTKWNYKLQPVYGVFMLCFPITTLKPSLLREAVMTVNGTNEILTDKMKAFIIELSEIKGKSEKDCKTRLEKWVYNIINMYSMTKELAFKDEMPIFRELEYYSRISKMTPEEYKEYQANLKRERDNYAVMEGAVVLERMKIAKSMKDLGSPNDYISKATGLSIEEIQNL